MVFGLLESGYPLNIFGQQHVFCLREINGDCARLDTRRF